AGAIDLGSIGFGPGATITVGGDSTGASADAAPPAPACGFADPFELSGALGVWYRFTGTGHFVTISTCQQSSDFTVRVYCGGCAALACVGADDDGCPGGLNTLGASVGVCTGAGVPY